jgi:hypothetical protein
MTISGIALLTAGCGSSPRSGSTHSPPQSGAAAAYRFAACMRNHGDANFPDPHVSSGNGHQAVMMAVPASAAQSPHFKAAQKACSGILPAPQNASQQAEAQQAHKRDLLAFAACLRRHGISGFPDPTSQGRLTLQMVGAAGVDIHTRAFLIAADACVGVTHGAVTRAEIDGAVNGSP